jgi:hypothetical protein
MALFSRAGVKEFEGRLVMSPALVHELSLQPAADAAVAT